MKRISVLAAVLALALVLAACVTPAVKEETVPGTDPAVQEKTTQAIDLTVQEKTSQAADPAVQKDTSEAADPVPQEETNVHGGSSEKQFTLKYTNARGDYWSLEKVISHSNTAFVGEYLDAEELEYTTRYRFLVKEDLYGNIEEKEVYLSLYRGVKTGGNAENKDQTFSVKTGGVDFFTQGKQYLLITERHKSIFYQYDQYLMTMPHQFNETDQIYFYAGKKYTGETGEALHEKVKEIHASSKETEDEGGKDGTWDDAPLIGEVEVLKKQFNGTKGYTGALHTVRLKSLSRGIKENIQFEENDTFYLVLDENLVKEGAIYEVAFTLAGDGFHTQNGKDTVRKVK